MAVVCAIVPAMASDQLISTKETLDSAAAMKLLHISRRTLDRYAAAGTLPFFRLPSGHRRYLRSDVQDLLTADTEGKKA